RIRSHLAPPPLPAPALTTIPSMRPLMGAHRSAPRAARGPRRERETSLSRQQRIHATSRAEWPMDLIMEDLLMLWRRRRASPAPCCNRCSGALLLQVGAASYRWRCRACGKSSERFVVRPDGGVQAVDSYDAAFARETFLRERIYGHRAAHAPRGAAGA